LHTMTPGTVDVSLGASEILPAIAILPFMVYQLAGFGTLHFIVSKVMNWVINIGILCLIIAGYIANLKEAYFFERKFDGALVVAMALTVLYGVLKLKRLQTIYDAGRPPKAPKE
jgi:hypothetical protein